MNVGSNPFFSLVIPTFNYARYMSRAIESILDQEEEDCEIIVVDDGSTDDTAAVVREYEARSQGRVRYVFQENRGPSAARNHGIRLSAGQYVLFLDADDELLPEALGRFRTAIESRESVDFVCGGTIRRYADGAVKHLPAMPLLPDRAQNFQRHVRCIWDMRVGAVAVRKPVFDRILFPESNRAFEHIIFYAHLLALYDGVTIPELVVIVHCHGDSLGNNIELYKLGRLTTVKLVFEPTILPGTLMHLRNEYLCGLWATLFEDFKVALQADDAQVIQDHLNVVPRLVALAIQPETLLPRGDRGASRACLSFFRSLYRNGNHEEARQLYHLALQASPMQALRWRYLRKYVRIALGGSLVRKIPAS